MRIARADPADPAVVALLTHHLAEAHRNSPPGSVFALDLSAYRDPGLALFGIWDGAALLGLGALRTIAPGHGEVKSMRTAPGCGGRGVGAAMLAHLLDHARSLGLDRVSLETGASDAYAAARRLYERAGFVPCAPFGEYVLTDFNRCYSLALDGSGA